MTPDADAARPHARDHSAPPASPNFDPVARVYRWCEYLALGPLLQRTRETFLTPAAHCRQALVLGDGDGRFTAELLRRNRALDVTAADASGAMLRLLRRRCRFAGARLHTLREDVRLLKPAPDPPGFDLVATHFLLDCLAQGEVEALVQTLRPALAPGALWLVSEFRVPAGFLHWPARLYIRALYLAFRLLTGLRTQQLPDHAHALRSAGFRPIHTVRRLGGMLSAELWQLPPDGSTAARSDLERAEQAAEHGRTRGVTTSGPTSASNPE